MSDQTINDEAPIGEPKEPKKNGFKKLNLGFSDPANKPRDLPPTRKASTRKASTRKPSVSIQDNVTQLMVYGGLTLNGFALQRDNPAMAFDGQVLLAKAAETGKAVSDIADKHPAVKEVLERTFQAGEWGSVIFLGMSIVAPILGNHGVIPAWAGGMMIPDGVDASLYRANLPVETPEQPSGTMIVDDYATFVPDATGTVAPDGRGTVYTSGPIDVDPYGPNGNLSDPDFTTDPFRDGTPGDMPRSHIPNSGDLPSNNNGGDFGF